MQEELKRHSNIGDTAGISYFARQVLGPSRVHKESVQKLCSLQNNIRLNYNAAVAFFKYLHIITEEDDFLCPTNLAEKIRNSTNFEKILCTTCLSQVLSEGFLDSEAIHYHNERNAYAIEKYALSGQAAIFRNILIQYKALEESSNELIIHSEYEDLFAAYCRKQKITKSLEKLKEQLEKQEIQGELAEMFVMNYEKRRLASSAKQSSIKRISLIDVKAGYDILSYETESSTEYDRFIEVKSYSGNPHFYWSQNEIKTAELLEGKYHIYLIDILKINNPDYEPTIIKDPIKNIWGNKSYIKTPTSYLVIPTD